MRRALTLLVVCSLITCLFYGCRDSRRAALIELVPASAFVVLMINWQTVYKDESLKNVAKGEQLESILRRLNLENSAVNEIAVFGASSDVNGNNGMLLSGTFKQRSVIDGLKSHGWQEQAIQNHKAYFQNNDFVVALESNILVFGTRNGVEGVLRAEANRSASFVSTANYKKLSNTFGDKHKAITMMLVMPQEVQDMANAALKLTSTVMDMAGVGSLGVLLEKIGVVNAAGCNISRSGNSFPVELVVMMKDESTAGLISGSLNLLKQFAVAPKGNVPAADADAYRSFQSMSISRNHEVLSIKMTMSERELLQGVSGR